MHPFGGTQICPRCSKAVYAAEQAMGPGRKLYHKPCLACTICNKRLDSFTLLEHDQKPYCKSCHVKNFGTHDLRQANLPHREDVLSIKANGSTAPSAVSPVRAGSGYSNDTPLVPRLPPNESLATNPISLSSTNLDKHTAVESDPYVDAEEERDTVDLSPTSPTSPFRPLFTGTPTNTGRPGHGGIPRTVPLNPTQSGNYSTRPRHIPSKSTSSIVANHILTTVAPRGNGDSIPERVPESELIRPLIQTSTGTRYGTALGDGIRAQVTGTGSPRKWGAGTPNCPRCGKSVFFAEQVKAIGKTYHKGCLRCTECNMLLDSSRLRDHDGEPLCMRCYGKLHGPQGSGYALLGKAGG